MIRNRRESGNLSETKALNFLEAKGFLLLQRNFYIKGGEIDLIFKDKDFLVFVEVKSLSENSERDIYSTLNKTKKKRLHRTINNWLFKNNMQSAPWRVDFIGITSITGEEIIEHFEFISLTD